MCCRITSGALWNFSYTLQVPVQPEAGQVQRTAAAFNFDLERRLLLEQAEGGAPAPAVDPAAVHDSLDEAMRPYLQMGLLVRPSSTTSTNDTKLPFSGIYFCKYNVQLHGAMEPYHSMGRTSWCAVFVFLKVFGVFVFLSVFEF